MTDMEYAAILARLETVVQDLTAILAFMEEKGNGYKPWRWMETDGTAREGPAPRRTSVRAL